MTTVWMRSARIFLTIGTATAMPAVNAQTVDPDGLVLAPLLVHNHADHTLHCQAKIAHWFALDLARIAPHASADLGLYFHTPSRTWAAMNAIKEALPVERVWCGLAGKTYISRWDVPLAATPHQARTLDCVMDGTRLSCQEDNTQ